MITTMLRGSTDLSRWLLLAGLLCYCSCESVLSSFENKTDQNEGRPRVFSPRMDYDEWTPLGRGDPLKNNPTFDYVPPVLDRVQYWLDSHTTEPSTKRDILVLGVTVKKTSPKIPEQFLKFVDGPKFTRTNQDTYRNEFTGSTGAEPPKLVRTTNFRNGPVDYRNQNRIQSLPASYYPSPYYGQKTKPYTMMLPPPLVQKPVAEPSTVFNGGNSKDKVVSYVEPTQQFSTQTEEGPVLQDSQFYALPSKTYNQHSPASSPSRLPSQSSSKSPSKGLMAPQMDTIKSAYTAASGQPAKSKYETTTAPSVSFEKSNLIYQSTQTLSGGWLGNNGPTSTSLVPDANQPTWQTSDYSRDQYEIDHHVAASSNHEVVVGQNANIIVDGDATENEEVVVGQKEGVSPDKPSATSESTVETWTNASTESDRGNDEGKTTTEGSSEKMHIVVANSPSSSLELDTHTAKKGPVAVVMPSNYVEKRSNATSQSVETSTFSPNISEISVTINSEKPSEVPVKDQPQQPHKNTATSAPMFVEDLRSSATPNKMMPHQPLHNQPSPTSPPRHSNPIQMFGPAQAPLQPMMHVQPRPNHGMMHFIGSMRPGVGFRPPNSMSHVSPPMSHIHAAPVKTMMGHMGPMMGMEHLHQRPPQMQPFPMPEMVKSFTSPPAPSTLTMHTMLKNQPPFDRHHSQLPEATSFVTTPTPFLPTLSPSGYTMEEDSRHQDGLKGSQSPLVKILSQDEGEENLGRKTPATTDRPSTTTSPQTTTVPSLTTDPIFSHYKQPAKPVRGPMYLIIQGHSKVKTYKPTVNKHGVPVAKNEVESVTDKQLSKFDQFVKENTKSSRASAGAEKKKLEEKARAEKLAQTQPDSLMSLVESGLGSFTVSPSSSSSSSSFAWSSPSSSAFSSPATEEEHEANSVTTVEVGGN